MSKATLPIHTYRVQWCRNEYDITGEMYAEIDADEFRLWDGAHGDMCVAACEKTARGKWAITTSDGPLPMGAYRVRFDTVGEVVAWIEKRWHIRLVEATCRCGTAENCD